PPPEESQSSADEANSSPDPPTQSKTQRQRRPRTEASGESEYDSAADGANFRAPTSTDVMVKKLVRLALSSEYSRQPIRRVDISNKVLGESRQFKPVFEQAQKVLMETFGMQLTELPGREKVTIQQRRAAQKVERPSSTNRSWILTSTLPPAYRKQDILPPTKAPMEAAYTGLYTFIIGIILLNGGVLQEQKLDRYLGRMNAETYTPIDRTDKFLQRLCKEGYLVRNREMDGGEEIIEYMVGPRGKVEVGARGVAGLVREVYGRQAMVEGDDITPAERERMEEFEFRLSRSLGLRMPEGQAAQNQDDDDDDAQEERQTRQPRRRPETDSESESDDE
ncbi:MAGE family-domain-containing protein, partial [Aspergillus pseudoustus]